MQVPPHPHIGLQTVTWLIAGTVLHRDSLGSEQLIRPGQLNLMTAGRGIAHSEESPQDHDPWLHGVQLWLALPYAHRQVAPDFEHHAELPAVRLGGLHAAVFAGSLAGVASPARVFSGVTGAEVSAAADARGIVPLAPHHEHVLFAAFGSAAADGSRPAARRPALPAARARIRRSPRGRARGCSCSAASPLGETLLMWWNLVGRTRRTSPSGGARTGPAGQRIGTVTRYHGAPLSRPAGLIRVRLARKAR